MRMQSEAPIPVRKVTSAVLERALAGNSAGASGKPLSEETVMTFPGTPDDESHDRFPLPRPFPRAGEGRFVSRIRDLHIKSRLGLALRPLTPEERRQADKPSGLRVGISNGPAARTSLRCGEIVLSVIGQPVRDGAEVRGLLDRAGKDVALLIERDKATIFVPIDIG